MLSNVEAEAREPLLKFLRQHYANVPVDARASELKKLAMPFGRGDPIIERHIRRCEDEEQRARETRTQRAPTLPRDGNLVTHEQLRTAIAGLRQLALGQDKMRQRALLDAIIQAHVEPTGKRFLRLEHEVIALKQRLALDAQFRDLEERLTEKAERWDAAKRRPAGPKGDSELADKTSKLERELVDAQRELADTKRELVAIRHEIKVAADVDERFHQLEYQLAARQNAPSQGELLDRIAVLERRIADLERTASLEAKFHALAEPSS